MKNWIYVNSVAIGLLLCASTLSGAISIKRATFDPSEAAMVGDAVALSLDGEPDGSEGPTTVCCDEEGELGDWIPDDSANWTVEWSGDCTPSGAAGANLTTATVGEKTVTATVTVSWLCSATGDEEDTEIEVTRTFQVVNVTRPNLSARIWWLGADNLGLPSYSQSIQYTLNPVDAPITIIAENGASKVDISDASGGTISVKATDTYSSAINDVKLVLKYDDQQFTDVAFYHTVIGFTVSQIHNGTVTAAGNGYFKFTQWAVNPSIPNNPSAFPASLVTNEHFDSRVDHQTNDWGGWAEPPATVTYANNAFDDTFSIVGTNWTPLLPENPTHPNASDPVLSIDQHYFIGSATGGQGAKIHSKTLNWNLGNITF
jgi:hypothetical protein